MAGFRLMHKFLLMLELILILQRFDVFDHDFSKMNKLAHESLLPKM